VKVGDLVLHRAKHMIDHLHIKYGPSITGILLYNNVKGGTLKLAIAEGKVYWALTSECEVISESR